MRFGVVLVSVCLLTFAVLMAAPHLRITGHEGDLIHTFDLVFRMAAGDLQHIDTMTPLGVLTIWPIALFVEAGFSPGRAMRLAEIAFTLAALPMILWVVMSRLTGTLRMAVAIGLVLLPTALVFGGDVPSISLSMYYNRWAWVLASLAVLVLFLRGPLGRPAVVADGLVLGIVFAALLLMKATYVLALAPFGLVALAHDKRPGTFVVALAAAFACLALATLEFGGGAFWRGYLQDILTTAQSPLRPQPGETFTNLLGKPAYASGSILALLSIIFWRKAGLAREGLLMLILAPGLIYITYQNWGNDPKWLALLAILLLARPNPEDARFAGMEARRFGQGMALAALVMVAPSIINIATSPYRHMLMTDDGFAPVFQDLRRDDILVRIPVHRKPRTRGVQDGVHFAEDVVEEDAPAEPPREAKLNGETLPDCATETGLVGWQQTVSAQLGAVEEAVGQTVLTADLLDSLWLFGPFERAPGGAPWYYGGDAGFDAADFVLVPLCPLSKAGRSERLLWMEDAGWKLEEILRTNLFILVKPIRPEPEN